MNFAEFIKSARKEKGLTQEQLGFELVQTSKAVNYMENSKKFPRIDEVEHIAEKLGYEVVYVKKGQK